ncbi:helix-turn-helix transcriptional regulator [Aneurinibacillus sp. REN35]|uniref:helix-turn-helix transcriptional regulator n=1 Tax=Aneurinibacillus sp. REN35 TaxID=3237286 RepID=UPI0035280686
MGENRQLEILLYLLKVKKTTHAELASTFEVSIKTIQRDIDKLSVMGIPITCKQGNQGGIFIDEHYKLSRSFFSNEDLQRIILSLSLYDSMSANKQGYHIINKLSLIAPDIIHLFVHDAKEYFIVDLLDEEIDMNHRICQDINHCLDEEYYLSVQVGNEQLLIAPISYVLRSDGLYLYAFEKKYVLIKIAHIALSQITEIEFVRDFIPYKKNKNVAVK